MKTVQKIHLLIRSGFLNLYGEGKKLTLYIVGDEYHTVQDIKSVGTGWHRDHAPAVLNQEWRGWYNYGIRDHNR